MLFSEVKHTLIQNGINTHKKVHLICIFTDNNFDFPLYS